MSYLYGSSNRGLIYYNNAEFNPVVYGDAAFMVHDDVKSRGGTLVMSSGGVIEAHSSKQNIITKSSTESELVNLDYSTTYALCIKRLVNGMTINMKNIVVFQDNQSVLALVKKGKPTSLRTKHISVRYFSVCQYVDSGEINIKWCRSEDMLADILTKPLGGKSFKNLRDIINPLIDDKYL